MAALVAIEANCNESDNEEPKMHTPLINRALWITGAAVAALLAGTAQAALRDRDLDGNGVTDAFYDTDLNITWLRDADMNGRMQWGDAVSWADSLSFAGYADWRLPPRNNCIGASCTGSEMGHLWYIELGNTAGAITNSGGFLNLRSGLGSGINPHDMYWSGTTVPGYPNWSDFFIMGNGEQGQFVHGNRSYLYAMAVRDGDVPAIPEPGTYALMLAGLAGLALRRRAAATG